MISYGLKPYNMEDADEGKKILEALVSDSESNNE